MENLDSVSGISTTQAIDLAYKVATEGKVPEKLFERFVDVLSYMGEGREFLDPNEVIHAVQNFIEAIEDGDYSILTQKRGLCVKKVVNVQEFVESKFFMGQKRFIRPRIMEELWNIFHSENSDGYIEVVLGGAIGIGKSYLAELSIAYLLYKLSCYHSPQMEYGLAPGSSIVFILQSIRLEQAKKVLFQQFAQRLKQSEYFKNYFPFNPDINSELRFPKNISLMPVSSSDTAALGFNVFAAILDELNFMATKEATGAERAAGRGDYDQAEKLYSTILRRMKSRYNVQGKVPGKIFLISSANYTDDFIDRKMKEAELEKLSNRAQTIYVMRMAQWESLPQDRLSTEKFYVEVGDSSRRSRILTSKSEAQEVESVIEVPMDYYSDFKRDLDAALRDLAGIPIGAVAGFIKRRESISQAMDAHHGLFEGQQLFRKDHIVLSDYPRLEDLINFDYLSLDSMNATKYAIHFDLAVTGDSCGVAIGHCSGFKSVGKTFTWDDAEGQFVESHGGMMPLIVIDGILEIIPPPSDEIDLNVVGDLAELIISRLPVHWATADQYQSRYLLQRLRKVKSITGRLVRSGLLSVDTSMVPYASVKQALLDERLLLPRHEKLHKELRDLQYEAKRGKIDHLPNGSKDLSDGVAGVVHVLTLNNGVRREKRVTPISENTTVDESIHKKRRRLRMF